VETAETNRQNGSAPASRTEEGIVTVVSAAEAAAARAGAAVAEKTGDTARADRLARQADRAARGEADHNVTGILLYALSTVRPPFLPLPVVPRPCPGSCVAFVHKSTYRAFTAAEVAARTCLPPVTKSCVPLALRC